MVGEGHGSPREVFGFLCGKAGCEDQCPRGGGGCQNLHEDGGHSGQGHVDFGGVLLILLGCE